MSKKISITWRSLITYLGISVGLISGLLGIIGYFKPSYPDLNYDVITNSRVFDIKEELGHLDILYNGSSIKQNNEVLSIIHLKVINSGANILNNYYDEKDHLGLEIIDGSIVESPELILASNDYLRENLTFEREANAKVIFPELIIERNEFFTIKLLVLHKENLTPKIIPIGKIAGVKKINVINSYKTDVDNSILKLIKVALGGSVAIQAIRALVYFLISLTLIISTIFLGEKAGEFFRKRRRVKLAESYKLSITNRRQIKLKIINRYVKNGPDYIRRMQKLLENESRLNDAYHKLRVRRGYKKDSPLGEGKYINRFVFFDKNLIDDLLEDRLVHRKENNLVIKDGVKKSLSGLISFLKSNKEFKEFDENFIYINSDVKSVSIIR